MKIEHIYGGRLYSEILAEGLKYIEDRMKGRIKSFKTPWLGVNESGVGGLEWGSMLTIGARPGAGKTLIVTQLLREAYINNPGQDFNILEFQFEMGAKQSASRAFAAHTALDYNLVLSTDKQLDAYAHTKMTEYAADCRASEEVGIVRIQINKSITQKQIEETVYHYYNKLGGKPMIITIDHSWLIKKAPEEREKIATLYNTVEMLMQLKNDLPVIVVMITQLNRSIEEPSRKAPGIIANFPTSSDIFGGDALMQGSDMVIALSRPAKNDIPVYGPKGYLVKTDDIFAHLLKVRNGADDVTMLYMKAEFQKQQMIEVSEPNAANPTGRRIQRLSTRQTSNQSSNIDLDDI